MERTHLFDEREKEHYHNSYCRDGSKICPLLNKGEGNYADYQLKNPSSFTCGLDGKAYDARRNCLRFKGKCGKFEDSEWRGTPGQKEQVERARRLGSRK